MTTSAVSFAMPKAPPGDRLALQSLYVVSFFLLLGCGYLYWRQARPRSWRLSPEDQEWLETIAEAERPALCVDIGVSETEPELLSLFSAADTFSDVFALTSEALPGTKAAPADMESQLLQALGNRTTECLTVVVLPLRADGRAELTFGTRRIAWLQLSGPSDARDTMEHLRDGMEACLQALYLNARLANSRSRVLHHSFSFSLYGDVSLSWDFGALLGGVPALSGLLESVSAVTDVEVLSDVVYGSGCGAWSSLETSEILEKGVCVLDEVEETVLSSSFGRSKEVRLIFVGLPAEDADSVRVQGSHVFDQGAGSVIFVAVEKGKSVSEAPSWRPERRSLQLALEQCVCILRDFFGIDWGCVPVGRNATLDGVEVEGVSSSDLRVRTVSPRSRGLCDWERDILHQEYAHTHIWEAASLLTNFQVLADTSWQVAVPADLAQHGRKSLALLYLYEEIVQFGKESELLRSSVCGKGTLVWCAARVAKMARREAEALAMSPLIKPHDVMDTQGLAGVFAPLLAPLLLPLMVGWFRELRRYYRGVDGKRA